MFKSLKFQRFINFSSKKNSTSLVSEISKYKTNHLFSVDRHITCMQGKNLKSCNERERDLEREFDHQWITTHSISVENKQFYFLNFILLHLIVSMRL